MDWKRRLIILAVPATLAVAGGAMVVAHAANSPTPPPAQSQTTDPAEPADTTGTADPAEATGTTETADPAEPAGAAGTQSGHADPAGNVDHQFDGQE